MSKPEDVAGFTYSYGDPPHRELRDYFAGQALPPAIEYHLKLRSELIKPGPFEHDRIAQTAYGMADAMMAERERKTS